MLNKKIGLETGFSRPSSKFYFYMDKLERLKKYANGGKVAKLQYGGNLDVIANYGNIIASKKWGNKTLSDEEVAQFKETFKNNPEDIELFTPDEFYKTLNSNSPTVDINKNTKKIEGNIKPTLSNDVASDLGGAAVAAINAVDGATMGDKNFSASSLAIDTGVHMASGALIKSGNPFAIGAGVALEGLNWLTKAGGQNVLGYDVNIKNSGYSTDMTHLESEAGRIWDKWSGATSRKLAKRNEKAQMALAAAEISNDVSFEQEARANSVDDILRQNTIALNGGIDTSLLGS